MSETKTTECPNCGKHNPVGAKFCSGCATALSAAPAGGGASAQQSTPPPPPPPSRPGLGGMLGQTGGKVEQRQVNGNPEALYAATEQFIKERDGSVIKTQYAPQQITAGIVFKDFLATLNAPVKVDCEINITPAGPGVSTVTVGGKADFGSASTLWLLSFILFIIGFLFISMLMFLILGIGGTVWQMYLLNARGPRLVAEDLFEYLNRHGGSTSAPAEPAPAATQAPPPQQDAAAAPAADQAENGAAEDDLATRIRKLDELKEQGLISDDEYNARRNEILQEI